jgi:hypothetical protein
MKNIDLTWLLSLRAGVSTTTAAYMSIRLVLPTDNRAIIIANKQEHVWILAKIKDFYYLYKVGLGPEYYSGLKTKQNQFS